VILNTWTQPDLKAGLEIREYGNRDPSRWPRCTLQPQKLALTSPTRGGRPVGIVRLWTQATEFSLVVESAPIHTDDAEYKPKWMMGLRQIYLSPSRTEKSCWQPTVLTGLGEPWFKCTVWKLGTPGGGGGLLNKCEVFIPPLNYVKCAAIKTKA
jgi:hypothetical protein